MPKTLKNLAHLFAFTAKVGTDALVVLQRHRGAVQGALETLVHVRGCGECPESHKCQYSTVWAVVSNIYYVQTVRNTTIAHAKAKLLHPTASVGRVFV